MIDASAIQQLVESQIRLAVDDQVVAVLTSDEWVKPLEDKVLKYTQDRILAKFSNSDTMPEIIQAVKNSVNEMFVQGLIPGVENYVSEHLISQAVDVAVNQLIQDQITQWSQDPVWAGKFERLINQAVAQRTLTLMNSIDISTVIRNRVDENMSAVKQSLLENFASTGIDDQATSCQFTIMDDTTVVENVLTTRELNVVESATVNHLAVRGSINTDNRAWDELADRIAEKTLVTVQSEWKQTLISQVADHIQEQGIQFEKIKFGNQQLLQDGRLSKNVIDSSLQSVGHLRTLDVKGETHLNDTASIVRGRVGINTREPEMALSIWDEEVSLVLGKQKSKQAFIGTNRDHSLALGVNRLTQIEIDTDGLTTVKKLRVGYHRVDFDNTVPGYSGTKGDIVFNSSPGADNIFAWVCLGAHKWKTLKSIE